MASTEEWVKQFQKITGRAPSAEEYQRGKDSGFSLTLLAAIAGGQEGPASTPESGPDAAKGTPPSLPKRAKSHRPWPLWAKILISVAGVVIVVSAILVAVFGFGGNDNPPTAQPTASSAVTKASSSSSSAPTRNPTTEQQLALVLLANGASRYTPSGQAIIDGSLPTQVTHNDALITDAPTGSMTYAMPQAANTKTQPVIVINGDTAYLGQTDGSMSFTELKNNSLSVDLASQWDKLWQSSDLAKLVKQISVVEASPDTSSSSARDDSQDDSGISSDSDAVWQQMSGQFIEDASTVSDGAPQLNLINEQDGEWEWVAHHYRDGAPKYQYVVGHLSHTGGDGQGGQIFAGTAYSPFNPDDTINVTFDLINANTYTVRSTDINYYGKFNRQ
ncbi:hypothetical protein [Lacticaseibacillus sp. GG6-2]